jgi:hypothetical protein
MYVRHRRAYGVDDADGVGARLLEDPQIDAALLIDANNLVLIGGTVHDLCHIGYAHRRCDDAGGGLAGPNDDLAQRTCVRELRVGKHVVVTVAGAKTAAR